MTWQTWWLFTVTATVLALTPGPAVLLVVSTGMRRGPLAALRSSAGILTANAGYFVLSATSLGTLFLASHGLFRMVQWLGSGYLLYLGLRAWFGRAPVLASMEPATAPAGGPLFLNALLVQAANPKALLFFVAILPQFLDPQAPLPFQVALLGVTCTAVEAAILVGYGWLAGGAARLTTRPRLALVVDRVAGSLLIVAALGLARQGHAH
jgi:homoserine/homoserine lactone efflux protein